MTAILGTDLRHPATAGLADITALLTGLCDSPIWNMDSAELSAATVECAAVVSQAHGLLCRLVGEIDHTGMAVLEAATSTVGWLRARTLMTGAEASRVVSVARTTRTGCTETGVELGMGAITLGQAAAITAAVSQLPDEVRPELRRDAERHLLTAAADFDAVTMTRLGRHLLEVIAPELAEEKLAAILARQEERDRTLREFRITPDGTGRHHLSGWLDALGAATVRAALDPLCAPCLGPEGAPDPRSPGTRRADTLIEICRRALNNGDLTETGGEKPHVTVTIPYHVLLDGIGHGTVDSGDPISPQLARQLACDAGIVPAVLDGHGYPMDVGRTQRTFTRPLRRALILRDRHCTFPSCDRSPGWCIGHDIIHWADGGPTALHNGALLCAAHHTIIHNGEWAIRMATDGHPEFIPPQWWDPEQKPRRNPPPRT